MSEPNNSPELDAALVRLRNARLALLDATARMRTGELTDAENAAVLRENKAAMKEVNRLRKEKKTRAAR